MSGLAKGIEKSRGLIEKAVSGVSTDMVITPKVGAMDFAGATGASSLAMSNTDSTANITAAISEAFSQLDTSAGDIIIPVYLGGTMIDEVVVNAQQRTNLRSGGR